MINVPEGLHKIKDYFINNNGVIAYIDDIMYSSYYGIWMYSIWLVNKYTYIHVSVNEFDKKWKYLTAEEANKLTESKFNYNALNYEYLLAN